MSGRLEVLSNIVIEFGVAMKLVRLIKVCLNETFRRVEVGKHTSDMLPVLEWFETWKCFIAIAFQLCFSVCSRMVQVNRDGLKLIGTHQRLFYAEDVIILGGSVHTVKEKAEALIIAIT